MPKRPERAKKLHSARSECSAFSAGVCERRAFGKARSQDVNVVGDIGGLKSRIRGRYSVAAHAAGMHSRTLATTDFGGADVQYERESCVRCMRTWLVWPKEGSDPSPGRTLAACLITCKSNGKVESEKMEVGSIWTRGMSAVWIYLLKTTNFPLLSGERRSNTWVTCPGDRHSSSAYFHVRGRGNSGW